jgi:hypothetical protein
MSGVSCSRETLASTLAILRHGGQRGEERVALWLSSAAPRAPAPILEVYEPSQTAKADRFYLPTSSMRVLLAHLRVSRLRIVAQIHTHPGRAFHSDIDAEWAIIRHCGALSLVLPNFAATTTPENFLSQVATYERSESGEWERRSNRGPSSRIQVTT